MMIKADLPQLAGDPFLTDGGVETTLIFHDGIELPHFAAFTLLADSAGCAKLKRYYAPYSELAARSGRGFIFESPTWRASLDWAGKLGVSKRELIGLNARAVALMRELQTEFALPSVVSGCIGPRGDGYVVSELMTIDEAEDFHMLQVGALAAADMVTATTMTNVAEAIGIARASRRMGLPTAISFTVETDGRLPSGQELGDAIEEADAASGGAIAYFMVNCAHPDHFSGVLDSGGPWTARVRGLRSNASRLSHAELNDATTLDAGDPQEFGRIHAALRARHPQLSIFGGCCGTDCRHVAEIDRALRV